MCSIRRLDPLGRICIPKDLRNYLRFSPDEMIEINLDKNKNQLILKKLEPNQEDVHSV